jgi:NADH-quinone oxidoreductase subunit F
MRLNRSTSGRQRPLAVCLGLFSALMLSATVGQMVIESIVWSHRATTGAALLDAMDIKAKQDLAQVAPLEEERKRQTEARLGRDARLRVQAGVVAITAVLFLLGAKWYLLLGPSTLPRRERLATATHTPPSEVVGASGWLSRKWQSWLGIGDGSCAGHSNCGEISPLTCHQDNPEESEDLAAIHQFVDQFVQQHGRGRELAIPALHALQREYRYVPTPALERLCTISDMKPAQVAGVVSFYSQFRQQPTGEHLIRVCHGTACHVAGAPRITAEIRRLLKIAPDADTDATRRFTIEPVACLGCCTLAPVARTDDTTHGHLTTDQIANLLENEGTVRHNGSHAHRRTNRSQKMITSAPDPGSTAGELRIGLGSCCVAGGSAKVYDALQQAITFSGARVVVKRVGCVGMCHQTPLIEAVVPGQERVLYTRVVPQQARAIVDRHFRTPGPVHQFRNRLAYFWHDLRVSADDPPHSCQATELRDPQVTAFLSQQKLIATEHSGQIDPTDLDEYQRCHGFQALRQCVSKLTPAEVIDQIEQSGLRGRGGGGFPTGQKWAMVQQATGAPKYVICNGDEGDPGAFMDRMLMESYPFRILEGLAIAAYAVGAHEAIFYIRAEYPLAVERIRAAIAACKQRGLLDEYLLETPYSLKFRVVEGAGAFICGEETALIRSIEGDRGMPRLRPPYPVEEGLWGQPTLINNVETLATVPWIIRHGPRALAEIGTPTSKGTKVFALTGKVKRGGLIEVPMGMTINQIVIQIGGGIKDGGTFKAVQIGGPSGGCIPARLADTPVDYEALQQVGAIMGSGGLVVMDQTDCMVDIARYFLTFTQNESCGKCTHCRIGTRRMLDILERICAGRGRPDDLQELERLGLTVGSGSLCGLGKTAPNPVLTSLRYFREEYEAHLAGRCPAGRCQELITYRVTDDCIGCTICAQCCPVDAIPYMPYQLHTIDPQTCICCDQCRVKCPEKAIVVE